MSKIALQINQSRLMENLKIAFTNKFTVLGELLQNARRAKASYVRLTLDSKNKTLVIEDDGVGVSDFQNLLSVADSGWDETTKSIDQPYGLGFLSALFASTIVTVESQGRRAEMETCKVIEGEVVVVKKDPHAPTKGSRITLHDFDMSSDEFSSNLSEKALGFPIPVFNGDEEIPRLFALDSGRTFIKTQIGMVSLIGIHHGKRGVHKKNTGYKFLQGNLIERSFNSFSKDPDQNNIIHLDPQRFQGRVPDRENLINEEGSRVVISNLIKQIWKAHLELQFAMMEPKAFIEIYYQAVIDYHRDLLNLLDFIPKELLSQVTEYPIQDYEGTAYNACSPYKNNVSRRDVESGEVKLFERPDFIREDGINADVWMFLYGVNAVLLDASYLPEDHWARPYHIEALDEDDNQLTVKEINPITQGSFSGKWVGGSIHLCEQIEITWKGVGSTTFTNEGMMYPDNYFLIPDGEKSGDAVGQASSYIGEYNDYFEDDYNEDVNSLALAILGLRAKDSAEILQTILDDVNFNKISASSSLNGQCFHVAFDEKGRLTVDKAA